MRYLLNIKSKNNRWPFPTLHIVEGVSEFSSCHKANIASKNFELLDNVPSTLFTVCEHCVYGRVNLRSKLYGGIKNHEH